MVSSSGDSGPSIDFFIFGAVAVGNFSEHKVTPSNSDSSEGVEKHSRLRSRDLIPVETDDCRVERLITSSLVPSAIDEVNVPTMCRSYLQNGAGKNSKAFPQ